MRLERQYVDITGVVADERSYVDGRTMHLCHEEMCTLLADPAFGELAIVIAAPGSESRILNMGDVVQPMTKPDKKDEVFPGLIGKMRIAGEGKTLLLRNIAVTEAVGVPIQIPCVLQLGDACAEVSELGGIWHVVIESAPAEGVSREDYLTALHLASKKLAKYLAELAIDCVPDETEVIDLDSIDAEGLPRIAYLADIFCHAPFTEAMVYGATMASSMPLVVQPTEVLDGAVTSSNYDNAVNADPTYVWQNHPVVLDLCRRHGKDVNFVGVVLCNVHHTVEHKQRNAAIASSIIARQLRADGCIISKEGGGHPQIDIGLAIDTLEGEYGVKTTALICEFMSSANDSYGQVLFQSKHANAIVSTGCFALVNLCATDKYIGKVNQFAAQNVAPGDETQVPMRSIRGCESQMGWTKYGSKKF